MNPISINPGFRDHRSENHRNIGKPLNPESKSLLAFLKAIRLFAGEAERPCAGVHPTAVVSEEAYVAQDASIGRTW